MFTMTQSQKRKFYSQELFDEHYHLKKYLRYLIILIGAIELFRLFVIETYRVTQPLELYKRLLVYITISCGSLFFFLSTFKCFEQKTCSKFSWRAALLLLSNLGLSTGTFLKTVWEVELAVEVNSFEVWLDDFTLVSTLAFGIVLSDVIYPHWLLKISLPLSMFAGLLLPIIEASPHNSFVLIFRVITSGLYVILLSAIKDRLRWKVFLKRIEDETWKALQMKILEEIPTSIAIMDINGEKIIYSNKEFQKFSGRAEPDEFFKKIINLMQRKESEELYKSLDSDVDTPINSYRSVNFESSPRKTSNGVENYTSSRYFPTTSTGRFSTLYDILKRFCCNYKLQTHKKPCLNIYDGTYVKNDEESVSFEVKVSCVEEYSKAIVMMNNTTQRDLIVSLTSNNKFKDNLLASISHELRTPVNGILALLESAVVQDQYQDTRELKRTLLEPALKSSKLLIHIINDILDYSQLSSDSVGLTLQEQSMVQTIKECYELTEFQVKKKGLRFHLYLDRNIPHSFTTDHARVKQILLNLLSNAMKFTFGGEIRLEAQMSEPNVLTITVADTGIGMNKEEKLRIFNSSVIKGEKVTVNSTGVGLGLTVSNRLAKLLGPSGPFSGQGLSIKSEPGKGSKVSFQIQNKMLLRLKETDSLTIENKDNSEELFRIDNIVTLFDEFPQDTGSPLGKLDNMRKYTFYTHSSETRITRHNTVSSFRSPTRKEAVNSTILIVDDDPFNILALETLLKPFGLQADSAYNGKEAIEKILKRNEMRDQLIPNYSLVFMDFNMPVMNGHEATRRLMELIDHRSLPNMKIVGCTAYNTKSDLDAGKKNGMVEVITKPVGRDKLLPILQRYLGL